jgi:hypothetical protein
MRRAERSRRESPALIRSLRTDFHHASSRSAPAVEKIFNRAQGASADAACARSWRALLASARIAASPRARQRVLEIPVSQAFMSSHDGEVECASYRAECASRRCAGAQRGADESSPRAGVVHHSLSGFAVFFVLL